MKKLLAVSLLGLCMAAWTGNAKEIFKDEFESGENWFKNPACEVPKYDGGGTYQFVEGGKSGKCLKIATNSKQTFMFNLRKILPVRDGARIRISFLVRGKGAISINPMGRTSDKKTVYLSANTAMEKINISDWEKIPFILSFKNPNGGAALTALTLRLNVLPNSELLIDNCIIEEIQ